jgi:hypothetical protein
MPPVGREKRNGEEAASDRTPRGKKPSSVSIPRRPLVSLFHADGVVDAGQISRRLDDMFLVQLYRFAGFPQPGWCR